MDDRLSIFKKKTQTQIQRNKFNKDEILNAIPKTAVKCQNEELMITQTEWRWRIFKFDNGRDIIEISYKTNENDRMYLDLYGNWVKNDNVDMYNKYLINVFYYYDYTDQKEK